MDNLYGVKGFDCAIKTIEPQIKKILSGLSDYEKSIIYEIRMRSQKPIVLNTYYGTKFLSADSALSENLNETSVKSTVEQVTETFSRLCCYSVHSHMSGIVKGYITTEGGHRAGITGTAVCDSKGNINSVKDISGINLRISREVKGSADRIVDELYKNKLQSIIIAGPPSSGKTTVLRDAVRQLSSGKRLYKIALIDERQEIASVNSGIAQNDVGINCDVLDCYPKSEAMMIALKTLSPQIIALDEVAEEKEIAGVRLAVNSGVNFIVTVHAADYSELIRRPQIQRLIETYSFSKVVMLKKDPIGEIADIYDTKELKDEIIRCSYDMDIFDSSGFEDVCFAEKTCTYT